MSFQWRDRVNLLEHPKGAARAVLIVLADMANDQGECWYSTTTIAKRAGCDRRTVRRVLKKLQDNPRVKVEVERRKIDDGINLTNIYRLVVVAPTKDTTPPLGTPRPEGEGVTPGGVGTPRPEGEGVESSESSIKSSVKSSINPPWLDFNWEAEKAHCTGRIREAAKRAEITLDDSTVTVMAASSSDRELLEERLSVILKRQLLPYFTGTILFKEVQSGSK